MTHKHTSIISCADVMRELYAFLDGEVDNLSETDIEQHLDRCRECFSRVEFEKKLRKKIQETALIETPPDVMSRMQDIMKKF